MGMLTKKRALIGTAVKRLLKRATQRARRPLGPLGIGSHADTVDLLVVTETVARDRYTRLPGMLMTATTSTWRRRREPVEALDSVLYLRAIASASLLPPTSAMSECPSSSAPKLLSW